MQEYIHRVGRTARGLGAAGNAVLLLRPEEIDFVSYLQESKIYLDKYEVWNSYYNLQPKVIYIYIIKDTEYKMCFIQSLIIYFLVRDGHEGFVFYQVG